MREKGCTNKKKTVRCLGVGATTEERGRKAGLDLRKTAAVRVPRGWEGRRRKGAALGTPWHASPLESS